MVAGWPYHKKNLHLYIRYEQDPSICPVLGSRDPIKTISKYLSIVQSIYFALKYFVTFKIYYGHAAVANSQIKNWDLHEKQMGGYSQRMSAPPNTTALSAGNYF